METCTRKHSCTERTCRKEHLLNSHKERQSDEEIPVEPPETVGPNYYTYVACWIGKLSEFNKLVEEYQYMKGLPPPRAPPCLGTPQPPNLVRVTKYGLHFTIAYLPLVSAHECRNLLHYLNDVLDSWRQHRYNSLGRIQKLHWYKKFRLHHSMSKEDIKYWDLDVVKQHIKQNLFVDEDDDPFGRDERGQTPVVGPEDAIFTDAQTKNNNKTFEQRILDSWQMSVMVDDAARVRCTRLPTADNVKFLGPYSFVSFIDSSGHLHASCELLDLAIWAIIRMHNIIPKPIQMQGWRKNFHKIQRPDQIHATFGHDAGHIVMYEFIGRFYKDAVIYIL